MKNIVVKWSISVLVLFGLFSCEDDFLNKVPLDGPSAASFYSNEEELKLGLYGCYEGLNFEAKSRRPWPIILDVTTDISWNRSNHQMQHIGNGSHGSDNGSILIFWKEFYKTIARCNFLLENLESLEKEISVEVYEQTKAEAQFVRALSYHYLIELFGDVPLITSVQGLDKVEVPRSSKADVANFVIDEMSYAASVLPVTMPDNEYHGRATKGAALAIKARTALYNAKWNIAASSAREVMELGFELHDNFEELFTYEGQTSKEIIFSLQYLKGTKVHGTPNFLTSRLAGGVSNEVPPQSMIDSYEMTDGLPIDESPLYNPSKPFENRDPRLGSSIVLPNSVLFGYQFETNVDSTMVWNYNTTPPSRVPNNDATNAYATYTGYLYRKYTDIEDIEDDLNSDINLILIRYAEVLLIYAEAKIEANDIDDSVYEAINKVRQRPSVEMPKIATGKNQNHLRSIIRKERKYELANEGLRLMDIRRWGIAEDVMSGDLLGRIPNEWLSSAPAIDENGTADYSVVANNSQMRHIENRVFNPNRDYLWPIPIIEILTNSELEQNPGY
ncbi:RagB/SusD family nutrient uptake outer membrane protein [Zobellia roscoffensis]|uniref:RagB/SusD family nutrient uptake outer membrane protein n=1 Tax=Zobellia roscoffensis TaxID=2779508 RepID=UPI001889F265|nr:RagB/SusD family nutrient uptake outer membrane protein [Zobellia roscoffensis]